MSIRVIHLPLAGLLFGLGCTAAGSESRPRGPVEAIPGVVALFSLDRDADFYASPFPTMQRLAADGTLRVQDFPNPSYNASVRDLIAGLGSSPVGFGTNAAAWFPLDGPIATAELPDPVGSLASDSPVFLVDVDPDSPERDQRIPIDVRFKATAETYSPDNLLVLLPRPGFSLRPGTWYAAVVTSGLHDADGAPLGSPLLFEQLKAERLIPAPSTAATLTAFGHLWSHLDRIGIARDQLRAATVYRTGDPLAELFHFRQLVLGRPEPTAGGMSQIRDHDSYCVVEGEVTVPVFQNGERPYNQGGGALTLQPAGQPAHQLEESIRFALSIPKQPMPTAGFPLLFYSAGQGGAYTQFVDRGTFAEQASIPGRGPALYLANIGVAAMSIEAPNVGPRHPRGDTSGLEFFNVANPLAFRDNPRQAALDFTTLIRMAGGLTVDATLCPEATTAGAGFVFDGDHFLFYGHSTGATIGSIVLGLEPGLSGGQLSGIGGSWLYNLTMKQAPLDFGALLTVLLALESDDVPDIHDPLVSLAQTLWEPSEPMNWARRWAREPLGEPKDILIIEGVVDGYFPPPMVNALAIAARLEPVGPIVDPSLLDAIAMVGGTAQTSPAGPNLDGVAALLVQHQAPPGVDGHYVPFERPEPKFQYRCFLASLLAGTGPRVPAPSDDPFGICPPGP